MHATTFHHLALWLAVATAVSFAAWAVFIALVATHTHSRQPSPVSAGLELGGDSTPAVAAMLANRWVPPHAAAAATFLDLAARNIVTLTQADGKPLDVRSGPMPLPDTACGYERQVYDLVVAHAGDGVTPCSALALGHAAAAERWLGRFSRSVIADARDHGLSRPVLSPSLIVGIGIASLVPAGLAGLAIAAQAAPPAVNAAVENGDNSGIQGGLAVLVVVMVLIWTTLITAVGVIRAERATPAGVIEAARWLGLRENLANDAEFCAQPATGIAVWDRLLAYGVGLGVAHNAAHDVPITAEAQREAWSDVTGTWRLVHIHYPSLFPPGYGQGVPMALVKGLAQVALSVVALAIWVPGLAGHSSHGHGRTTGLAHTGLGLAGGILAVAALALLIRGIVQLVLLVWDMFDQRSVEGRVVRYYTSGFVTPIGSPLDTDLPRRLGSWEYGLTRVGWRAAVDDGSSDQIDAWFVSGRPPDGLAEGCGIRATVTAHLHRVLRVCVIGDLGENTEAPEPSSLRPRR